MPRLQQENSPNWKGDAVGYFGAHKRIRTARGPASGYDCVRCAEVGRCKQAHDWALIHGERGFDPWSDYVPLCRACHIAYDGAPGADHRGCHRPGQGSGKWRRPTSSQYKGVSWDKSRRKWTAQITVDRRQRKLGGFADERAAAQAYDAAAVEAWGEHARLNFPVA